MDLHVAGQVGRGGRQRRGFRIPDVRGLLGLLKTKVVPRTGQPGTGNLNAPENQIPTREELHDYLCQFLEQEGVSREEFHIRFEAPRGLNPHDDDVVDVLHLQAGGIYYQWSGLRREFYYLILMDAKEKSAQNRGDMKSISTEIEHLKEELRENFREITSRNALPYDIPEVFKKKFDIVKVKKGKSKRGRN